MQYFYKTNETQKIDFNGKELEINITTKAFYEDEPFDGDHAEDIAAYNAGEFTMVGITVVASFKEVDGRADLGMSCYKSDDDIVDIVNQYAIKSEAIDDLKNKLSEIKNALCGQESFNGWSNVKTWKLWTEMQNTESTYLFWEEQKRVLVDRAALINRLQGYYGENCGANLEEIADALLNEDK